MDVGFDFVVFEFEGLNPGSPVHVTVNALKKDWPVEQYDLLFETPAPPEQTGTLTIAFGSCSKDSRLPYVPVYEAMAFEQADIAVFVGDNTYFTVGEGDWSTSGPIGDWNSIEQMISRHMRTRTNPYLQNLLRNTPNYGIWDDHDYGPNNSDRELESKEEALDIFKAVWANPYFGTPKTRGVFSKFRRGPADIFLMDDRYHKYVKNGRHPNVSAEDAVIWGDDQLEWLCNELKRSKAPVKIIANGTQVISKDGRGEGHFNEAPEEIAKLMAFLKKNKIGGVVFLSGDRHITEVLRLEQEDGPSLVEFTSSPFQQGQAASVLDRDHPTHVWAMRGNSYGLVTIEVGNNGEGFVRFEMRDANNYVPDMNGEPAAYEVPLKDLMYEE
ncbi:MAG: alkaline phosphatase D family protein, partial [Candidatus Hydrogenedentota bacterium]